MSERERTEKTEAQKERQGKRECVWKKGRDGNRESAFGRVTMGSSSSSYAPKTIYLDVEGKVQKVGPLPGPVVLSVCLSVWGLCSVCPFN